VKARGGPVENLQTVGGGKALHARGETTFLSWKGELAKGKKKSGVKGKLMPVNAKDIIAVADFWTMMLAKQLSVQGKDVAK